MARLAATEKGLYYPTDLRPIELLKSRHVRMSGRYTILDPCIGEAIAVNKLTETDSTWYKPAVYGIEIEKERALAARDSGTTTIWASFEECLFIGKPQIIFMNPPYDDDLESGRTELDWIDKVAPLLEQGRQMIMVLPERIVLGKNEKEFRLCLYKNKLQLWRQSNWDKESPGILKFPEPEFQSFKQYFVIVTKVNDAKLEKEIPVAGVVGECSTRYNLKLDSTYGKFEVIRKGREVVESILTDEARIIDIFGPPAEEFPITPLQPMIPEITAAVIAGGMFTGIQVDNVVVRGGITIKLETIEDEDEKIETQRMIAHVVALDMSTGEITKYRSDENEEKFGEYIEEVATQLQDILREKRPSYYQMERDFARLKERFKMVHAPRAIEGRQNGLFDYQDTAVATVLRGWELQKSIIMIGQMGTGKTIISIASAIGDVIWRKPENQKIVILMPSKNDLVKKWAEEIHMSCRDLHPLVVKAETISDVRRAFEHKGLTFILMKESMAKRTSGWHRLRKRKVRNGLTKEKQVTYRYVCWNCGQQCELFNSDGKIPEKDGEIVFCNKCGVMYKADIRDRNGNAYASIARYVSKHYKGQYVMIADEAHQYKGGDTARGYASASLIEGARKCLMMTGTVYNGYASSIFFTLYRAVFDFRKEHTYDGVKDYVRKFGLEQTITKFKNDLKRASWSGYKEKQNVRTKEIPGIHPTMIASMLPFTVFVKLEADIPPQHAHTLFLDMPDDLFKPTEKYLNDIRNVAVEEMNMKPPSMALMGAHTWANLGAWDMTAVGDKIYDHVMKEHVRFTLEPIKPDKLTPKEEALLRIVLKHRQTGFPTLIFYLQTKRRPIEERLLPWFDKYGMRCVYMPGSVSERKPYILNALSSGADAILTNASLVNEGIDLLEFGATVWYSATNDAVLVDQANARNHRIGQAFETDVYYLAYNETYQAERWAVTAKKVAAMQAIHGNIRAGISALLGDESLINVVQETLLPDKFDHQDSDLTLDDLPELVVIQKSKPIEAKTLVPYYKELKDWADKNDIEIPKVGVSKKKRNFKRVPEGQMTLL